MKRTICLTLNLDVKDPAFESYSDYRKLNREELPKPNPTADLQKRKSEELDRVAAEIKRSSDNLIIGRAIWSWGDYLQLRERLQGTGHQIAKIFIPSTQRREENLAQSQKEYALHSRWFDHPPGYIEEQFKASTALIHELIREGRGSGIEIIPL